MGVGWLLIIILLYLSVYYSYLSMLANVIAPILFAILLRERESYHLMLEFTQLICIMAHPGQQVFQHIIIS